MWVDTTPSPDAEPTSAPDNVPDDAYGPLTQPLTESQSTSQPASQSTSQSTPQPSTATNATRKTQPITLPESAQAIKLVFRGTAREYFPIWIVNLFLSLATLGIYSAWAKVRKKRYFYSHTTLDGTPFQYLAQPLPILKGRLIAVTFFAIYWTTANFFLANLPWVLLVMAIIAPWVVVRSAVFNARYSAYRNLTFDFDGGYWGALKVIYGWALLTILTLGIAFSWWQQRVKRFMVRHFSFGGQAGEFDATGGQYLVTYIMAGLIMLGAGIVIAAVGFAAAAIKPRYVPMAILPVIYVAYLLSFALIRARLGNLVWNHTRLGPLGFRSTLDVRKLAWIYFTNALGLVASVGLLTPWAVIRTLKYRADNMEVLLHGDLSQFVGGARTAVAATGAEMGEIFDVDLSL